jgi:autotransporter family porin
MQLRPTSRPEHPSQISSKAKRITTAARRAASISAAVAAVLASASIAPAAVLTWDADAALPLAGGSGPWNTTSSLWTADGGSSFTTWSNANPDSAVFGGAAGTVTLAEAITAGSLTFNTSSYVIDLNGNSLTQTLTGNLGGGISTATITNLLAGPAPTYTHNAGAAAPTSMPLLGGNLNVTLSTSATWILPQANSFTGLLKLTGNGQFRTDAGAGALGATTSTVEIDGTTRLNFATVGGTEAIYPQNFVLTGDTTRLSANGDRNIYLTGQISGGALNTVGGQGAIILAGNNTFSGPVNNTTVADAGSAVVLAHNGALGASTAINIGSGDPGTIGFMANLATGAGISLGTGVSVNLGSATPTSGVGIFHNYSGNNRFAATVTLGSNTTRPMSAERGSSLTLTGNITGGKGILKLGDGTLVLTGQNNYGTANATTGNETAVNAGVLSLDFSQATWETTPGAQTNLVNNGLTTSGNITGATHLVLGGGTLEV